MVNKIPRHEGREHRNQPDNRKTPFLRLHFSLGQFVCALRIFLRLAHDALSGCSQINLGSKLAEARIVKTTTAVNGSNPGPGKTVANCLSRTSATRIESRKTSSIAQGPMASIIL